MQNIVLANSQKLQVVEYVLLSESDIEKNVKNGFRIIKIKRLK